MGSEGKFFALDGCSEQTLDVSIKGYEFGVRDILHLDRVVRELEGSVKFRFDNVVDSDGGGNYVDGFSGLITGYSKLTNGVSVMWFGVGGTDEIPVAACVYMGIDRSVHVYVPFEGNVFDRVLMRAYRRGEMSLADVRYDSDKLVSDASSHIVPKRPDWVCRSMRGLRLFDDDIPNHVGNDADFLRYPFNAVPHYVCGDFSLSPDVGGSACAVGMDMGMGICAEPVSPVSARASASIPSHACPGGPSIEITPEQREELLRILGQPLTAETMTRSGLQVNE